MPHQRHENPGRSERLQQAAYRADRAVVGWLKSVGLPSYILLPGIALWRISAAVCVIAAGIACWLGVFILRAVSSTDSRESDEPFRADDHQASLFYHPREHNDGIDPRFDEESQRW